MLFNRPVFDIGRFAFELDILGPGCMLWCGSAWFRASDMFKTSGLEKELSPAFVDFAAKGYSARSKIRVHQPQADGSVKAYECLRPADTQNLDFYMWSPASAINPNHQVPASHPMYAILDDIMLVPGNRMARFDFAPPEYIPDSGAVIKMYENEASLLHVTQGRSALHVGVDYRDTMYNAVGVTVTCDGVMMLFVYSPEPPHTYYVAKTDREKRSLVWVPEEEAFEFHNLALNRVETQLALANIDPASVHAAHVPSYFHFDYQRQPYA